MPKNKMSRLAIFASAIALRVLLGPNAVGAIPLNDVQTVATNGGLAKYTTASEVFLAVLDAVLGTAFVVAVIFAVVAGYRLVVSAGQPERVTAAKNQLFWTIGGVAVIVLAWVILTMLTSLILSGSPGS